VEIKMNSTKKYARIAGILFIIATTASILSLPFLKPINSPTYLVDISANANLFLIGVFLSFIAAFASASIAISLYPILRRYNEALALGAVGFRLIESVFYIVGAIGLLMLFTLSQEFLKSGAPASSYFNSLGVLLLAGYHLAGNVGSVLAFCIGASLYYLIFYKTRLVPRWLSAWGLIGTSLLIVAILMVMFQIIEPFSTPQIILALPIAFQEMVLAVWLIIKGFNSSAVGGTL
jgi:hypothetical protein